jgi:hypothetical protein
MFYTKGDKQDFVKKRKMKTLMFVKGKNWKKKMILILILINLINILCGGFVIILY